MNSRLSKTDMPNLSCDWLFRLEKIRTSITKTGTFFGILTLLVGVAAVNTGNNLLYVVLSMMLSVMAISGFESLINIKGLEPHLAVPDEIYARMPAVFALKVKSIKPLPSFLIRCMFPGKTDIISQSVIFQVPGGGEKLTRCQAVFPRRGLYKLERLILVTTFPFGFTNRWRTFEIDTELIVYPHIHDVELWYNTGQEAGELEGSRREGVGGDFMGLRGYTPRDKLSMIHWKSFAKTGQLMVKQFADREGIKVMIEVPSDATDKQIEEAASIAVAHLNAGNMVALKLGDTAQIDYGTGDQHRRRILKELALFNL